jgi:hypothetical protein
MVKAKSKTAPTKPVGAAPASWRRLSGVGEFERAQTQGLCYWASLGAAWGDGCEVGELVLPEQKLVVGAIAGGFGGSGVSDDACGFHFFGSLPTATVDIFVGHQGCSVTRGRDRYLGEGSGPFVT